MTSTPLEQHRDANADASALAAIKERIEASSVEYVYHQGVTITGRVIGKVVPARHLLRNAERGVQLHRTAAEFTMMPDLDTQETRSFPPTLAAHRYRRLPQPAFPAFLWSNEPIAGTASVRALRSGRASTESQSMPSHAQEAASTARSLLLSEQYGCQAGGAAKPRCARNPGALSLSRPTAS
jgi:hypothetical protein